MEHSRLLDTGRLRLQLPEEAALHVDGEAADLWLLVAQLVHLHRRLVRKLNLTLLHHLAPLILDPGLFLLVANVSHRGDRVPPIQERSLQLHLTASAQGRERAASTGLLHPDFVDVLDLILFDLPAHIRRADVELPITLR